MRESQRICHLQNGTSDINIFLHGYRDDPSHNDGSPWNVASIINPQYQKTLREFQNAVKYHEESLEKLEAPVLQPPRLPNREYTSARFPYRKANVNLVGWSKNIGTPSFPKDDSNISPRKPPIWWA